VVQTDVVLSGDLNWIVVRSPAEHYAVQTDVVLSEDLNWIVVRSPAKHFKVQFIRQMSSW
jgi:predicted RNA methylase